MESGTYTSEIMDWLDCEGREQEELHKKARVIRNKAVSSRVYLRGLIEFSNICTNDCFYCGIRKSNSRVQRYQMEKKEIMESAKNCAAFGSIILQSGERKDQEFIDFVCDVTSAIRKKFSEMRITLCVGEQKKETYQRFFDAGASRYLLRIETSNKRHYSELHPSSMNFDERKKCLKHLKGIGFQVGTGVMIGSPFQTMEDLAADLSFFKEIDSDMIGMGPFLPHQDAPIQEGFDKTKNLKLSLNMIAALRILMPQINIAATTSLQAIHPYGREMGLLAGANVIMPTITPTKYRKNYRLYSSRPCIDESARGCTQCIIQRIKSTGLTPALGEAGDSRHFLSR